LGVIGFADGGGGVVFEQDFDALGGRDDAGGAEEDLVGVAATDVGTQTRFGLADTEIALIANEAAFEIAALDGEAGYLESADVAAGVKRSDFGGKQIVNAEGAGDFEIGGTGEDLFPWTGLHEAALLHEADVIRELHAFFEIMRDENDGRLRALASEVEDFVEGLAETGVETAGGFVEQ
jgi:hypothetical protein